MLIAKSCYSKKVVIDDECATNHLLEEVKYMDTPTRFRSEVHYFIRVDVIS